MDATKVEVALRWYVGNIRWYLSLLAKFPDGGRSCWVVHRYEDHVCAIEIRRFEDAIDVGDLVLGDAMSHFVIEAARRTHNVYNGISIEAVENAPSRDLYTDQWCA
jgi:hypothetical protein